MTSTTNNGHAYTIGQTIHTECGQGRITFHPDWSESQPWAAYVRGTATRHFADVPSAAAYFAKQHNMILNTFKVTP